MSKPRRNDRHDWSMERQAEAESAAKNGHGWEYLARLWDCSRPNALQWCKVNCDPEVSRLIALNGYAQRQPHKGRLYHNDRSKPPMQPTRQSNGKVYWVSCHHVDGMTGERCFAPTQNGKHACPKCLEKEMTIKNPRIRDTIKTYIA
jgi:hypothetical protein